MEPTISKTETIIYSANPIVPTAYIEKPPFPIRIKEHAKATTVVNKSNIRAPRPSEQIKVEPNIAMVKDLLADNIVGMLFISVMKQLELLSQTLKIKINL
jgi:hypothetical protein